MDLAKEHLDAALFTNALPGMLRFWQKEVGLAFEELLPTGAGNHQHRHGVNGSVLKINHNRDPLPDVAPAGYRELLIARPGLETARSLRDPDGNAVRIVPQGEHGVVGIGVRLAVRDPKAAQHFYEEVLGFERVADRQLRCGDSVLFIEESPGARRDAAIQGPGYRYLTIQVRDCEAEHAGVLARGGEAGLPPRRMGDVAMFSFVRDPDGNWIEISQRASLTGAL